MAYESLAELIEPYVDESFVNLPTFLQERVTEDFFPMPHWDVLAPEQRRSLAQQHDGRHDPAKEPENAHYWNIGFLIEGKKKEFEKWESMPEPIPSEAILKEQRLHTLRGELAALESRFNEPYQAPPGQDTATSAPVAGKKWTPEKLAELKAYREAHTMPETAAAFGITEQRIRQLQPSKKPKAKPFAGLIHRIK